MKHTIRTCLLLALIWSGLSFMGSCSPVQEAGSSKDATGTLAGNSSAAQAPIPSEAAPLTPAGTPSPTATRVPPPTPTRVPSPTRTHTPYPTRTHTPFPTATSVPSWTPSSVPSPLPTDVGHPSGGGQIPIYTYQVVNVYPHDRDAWTQGLVLEKGVLYEGTGRRSSLRRVDLESGDVLQFLTLPDQLFGEGITVFDDRIIQLTWKSRVGFVYDRESFELLRTFQYPTEGWGITHDGSSLIMSDGSATLHFLDPETLEEVGQVQVHDGRDPVLKLNELEYVEGEIYANVWQTNRIARIDPESGRVTGWIDLSDILDPEDYVGPVGVLNGIAYDRENERLYVTGKLWPRLFQIELIPSD